MRDGKGLYVFRQFLDHSEVVEKFFGEDADDGVGRNGEQHPCHAGDVAGHQDDQKDLQRVCFHGAGVDVGLQDDVVDQLEYDENDHHRENDRSGCRSGREAEQGDDAAENPADQGPDVGYDVQHGGDRADDYGGVEFQSDQVQGYGNADQFDEHFDADADKVAHEEGGGGVERASDVGFVFGGEEDDDAFEKEAVVFQEEVGDEADGEEDTSKTPGKSVVLTPG